MRVAANDSSNAIKFGGGPPAIDNTELWNGSNWTEVNDMNTARYALAAAGTYTAALGFGGNVPPNTAVTEQWNGTNWTEIADLATARWGLGGNGNTSLALASGGGTPTPTDSTEEWSDTVPTTVTFGDS